MLYSLKDVTIIPATISNINSRSECNVYKDDGFLPLFTAPMTSVVGEKSVYDYLENKINPIIPRSVSIETRLYFLEQYEIFVAFNLSEIEDNFIKSAFVDYKEKFRILIDIANGNMKKMFDLVDSLKELYEDDIIIMAGNIANPATYYEYCLHGIDYCRTGIGGGKGCLTTTNVGIHYPLGSLIFECNKHKQSFENPTKIIADGGIKGYSDIIKSLALGADYVMCGSVFAKMEESEAPVENILDLDDELYHKYKSFYGMSTPKAQKELGGDGSKATEGQEIIIPVEYTVSEWVFNFESYLKSAMSYCNCNNLDDFIGKVKTDIMSESSINNVNQ